MCVREGDCRCVCVCAGVFVCASMLMYVSVCVCLCLPVRSNYDVNNARSLGACRFVGVEEEREVGDAAAAKCAASAKVEYPLGTLHLPHIHSFSCGGAQECLKVGRINAN